MLTQRQYDFLTGAFYKPGCTVYEETVKTCQARSLSKGFYAKGPPILTYGGLNAIKAFQEEESRRKCDVI